VVGWLLLLLRIRKVPGSILGSETSYPELVEVFLKSLQANVGILLYIMLRPFPSTSFPMHHSLMLSFIRRYIVQATESVVK
jgi:hypothetical protein